MTKSGSYIELQDLWKSSYPAVKAVRFETDSSDAFILKNKPSLRRRPTPFPTSAAAVNSPTLPYYPTSPLPSPKSPFFSPRSRRNAKSRHFKSTKQRTSAAFNRVTSNLTVHFHSGPRLNLLRKMMNTHTQRVEKKEEAKKLAKDEFHKNWDNMTEEEQTAYTKEREESRLRERKRLDDMKNGTAESRRADAKTAAISGAIVVCM